MRSLRIIGMFLCVLALVSLAAAAGENLGIRDTYRITFVAPVHVGTDVLPAGDYKIRHTMEGQEHVMVFQLLGTTKSTEVKVKCTLVPLAQKAPKDQTIYMLNAANERVLQELIFRGDKAKHVF
jgi:hypothetical protein